MIKYLKLCNAFAGLGYSVAVVYETYSPNDIWQRRWRARPESEKKKGSTVVPYRRSTISPARVSGNWKEITRRKESNNTHSPRFTYVRARPAPSAATASGRPGWIRPQKSYRVLLGRIYITDGFIFIVFLSLTFFIPPPHTPVHPSTVPCHLNTI